MPEEFMATTAVPAWRQQLQLDTDASNQMVNSSSQWPPQEWGEERRAATARMGPDGEPDPQVRGTPVKILVSGLGTLKVGKKIRKKGTPGKSKGKRKGKRSPSPAARTAGSSDTNMEGADDATAGKEVAEALLMAGRTVGANGTQAKNPPPPPPHCTTPPRLSPTPGKRQKRINFDAQTSALAERKIRGRKKTRPLHAAAKITMAPAPGKKWRSLPDKCAIKKLE
jgi:hypothetical protein